MITQENLKKWVSYNPKTGEFLFIKSNSTEVKIGDVATVPVGRDGDLEIFVGSSQYLAQELAWLYYYGEFPVKLIYHADGDRSNNAIDNIQEVFSNRVPNSDLKTRKDNKTGIPGILRRKLKDSYRWDAVIWINKKQHALGRFVDLNEAICVRLSAEQCFNFYVDEMDSSAYKWVKKNIQDPYKICTF